MKITYEKKCKSCAYVQRCAATNYYFCRMNVSLPRKGQAPAPCYVSRGGLPVAEYISL